jgi:histidyl-tRNA synthetase
MKLADRVGSRLTLLIGEDELAQGVVTLRDMLNKEQRTVAMDGVVQAVEETLHERPS